MLFHSMQLNKLIMYNLIYKSYMYDMIRPPLTPLDPQEVQKHTQDHMAGSDAGKSFTQRKCMRHFVRSTGPEVGPCLVCLLEQIPVTKADHLSTRQEI